MPLLGNQRSFARIRLNEELDESFALIDDVLKEMKLKPKNVNEEKYFIHGRTKMSFLKNKFAEDFRIMAKAEGTNSVIDIYYNGIGITGPDAGTFIEPCHKKLCKIISENPPIDIEMVDLSDEEIEETAGEVIHSDNVSDSTHSVADEIAKLSKLKADGAISEEEFTKMKNDLIDKM